MATAVQRNMNINMNPQRLHLQVHCVHTGKDCVWASTKKSMLVMLCLLVRHGSLGAIGLSRTRTIVSLAGREHIGLPKAIVQPSGESSESSSTQLHKLAERVALPELPTPFTVLGIETSCDDTGVAIVRSDGTVLGESLASQAALHEEWGGVVPNIARDAHAEALNRTIAEALERAGMSSAAEVDAIAVTTGPGLEICLRVGCEGAKSMAITHGTPIPPLPPPPPTFHDPPPPTSSLPHPYPTPTPPLPHP